MTRRKRSKRNWSATIGHGSKVKQNIYATWGYFYTVAKAHRLSVAELLERSVSLYEINNVPSIKELEAFRSDLKDRIKLMEFRIGTSRPTDLDLSILDFYREILDDSDSLMPAGD